MLIILCFAFLFPTEPANADEGKKTIMVFAPHQDDEANMANAVMYSHAKRGDDVYVVMGFGSDSSETWAFDQYGLNRLRQSAKNMEVLGIPSSHLIYLGYQKIDHASQKTNGVVVTDENGAVLRPNGTPYKTMSHVSEGFPSYHYTKYNTEWESSEAHMLSDIVDILKQYQPDEIYAINYDSHIEHMWLGGLVDQAFGIVKKTEGFENYCPRYYQSMSYQTAWQAPQDMTSTVSPNDGTRTFLESTTQKTPRNPTFAWADRVRFPVEDEMSSPDPENNLSAKAYLGFGGTVGPERIKACVNGDQVFWERDTRSLTYQATVTTSSNGTDSGKLNDFSTLRIPFSTIKTLSTSLNFSEYKWSPENDDTGMTITLSFKQPQTIASVKLYDDYNSSNRITAGVLRFSDDSTVDVGSLNNNGSATTVTFPEKTGITSVSFKITDFIGTPGLTEFEVYSSNNSRTPDFIQIYLDKANGSDWTTKSFLYDYPVDVTSQAQIMQLGVYCYPDDVSPSAFTWKLSGGTQGITLTQSGLLTVTPEARSGVYQIQVSAKNNPSLKDEMTIQVNGNTFNPADINMDGHCDYRDLAYVLMGMDGFYQDKADVNGDGIVNAEDVNRVWEQIKFSQK